MQSKRQKETRIKHIAGYGLETSNYVMGKPINETIKPWSVGKTHILGDSMLLNLYERRLGKDGNVKVRFHK